jgi:2-dehydropantoate 2-reductase
MNILIYGAGVIGTVYAARLQESGQRVTVLARGRRLAEIRGRGLEVDDLVSGRRSMTRVLTTECLAPADQYDVVLIAVRRDQLAGVLPALQANRSIPTMLFMLNNPIGSHDLARSLGQERVLFGFPGTGGMLGGNVVRFAMISQQPTTLGELNGRHSARVLSLAGAFRAAGFPTAVSPDMDTWLKAHAFFVTAVSGAIYMAGGDCRRLAGDKAILKLMAKGVREGFAALRALGLRVTPFQLGVLFTWLPSWFAVAYWRRFFASDIADYVFGRHARSASSEMRQIAGDCRTMLDKSGAPAPCLEQLYQAIDP